MTAPRVLYLVYWGACEPLGQALVVPAVNRLSELGARITLVTFEKPADLADSDSVAATRTTLEHYGVRWLPLAYHKRPKVVAKAVDFLMAWAAARRQSFDIVHARTYVGGLMGWPLARGLGARFVYHNEGFYPDEQVDHGLWRAGSWKHRLAKALEYRLYAAADGVIALSERSRSVIDRLPPVRRRQAPTVVAPSCVDLSRFVAPRAAPPSEPNRVRLTYVGSIGRRYLFHRVARFAAVATQSWDRVEFRVLTPAPPDEVAAVLLKAGMPDGSFSVGRVPPGKVPSELVAQDAGLHFLPRGLSEYAGSPTKVGEYWAAGLPVVITPNVGDTEEVIHRDRVGVVVPSHSDEEYVAAARRLQDLLRDPGLAARCVRAAGTYYNLASACRRQRDLYESVLKKPHTRRSPSTP